MIFSSLEFLCVFLPIVFCLYYLVPSIKGKNILLILASLLFYAYGEPIYVFLMIFSALLNFLIARAMDNEKQSRKAMLVVAVTVNIGLLVIFKYTDFLINSWNSISDMSLPTPKIALPIGISFFTFQALSYVIDVYLRKEEPQKNFFHVLLYISFFPQLIAGPIVKYKDIRENIENRVIELPVIVKGLRRFICGLGKKVLIANALGQVADVIFNTDLSNVNILTAWLGAISYVLQLYYDFSGYSDMAIGLGAMFGFHFQENFQYPYGARSIKEFWHRWHISLSSWFRDYLYIPLGGNRKGKGRTCINKLIVFFLTGLWHGANWTFVVWGLFHGFFLLLEDFVPVLKRMPKVLGHIYTMLVVSVGFVIFRADTLSQGLYFIKQMFTGFSMQAAGTSLFVQQLTPWFICMLVAGVIGAAPIKPLADKLRSIVGKGDNLITQRERVFQKGLYVLSIVLLCWCIIRLSGNTYNPFIYFRF